ncbi:SRPBCC family protein [Streptomyces johnsoniae]|uniref:SRPBCC family protein n=1 Tax=Streptomyces johnsoniae TaxID=3075532 RepID=A0ABU2SEH7_9ACTN|nr:SRPBCC family protein [Streptomyces sp. DSM 41886]MDT0446264.1 SRPBCC family protein [Streptomyces sp. DSM 41886]
MTMSEADMDRAPAADGRRGTLGVGADGAWQIRFERRIGHPPQRVWDALADPAQRARWMPGVTLATSPDAPVRFDFGDEGGADGRVVAADPPRSLEHTWQWPGEPAAVVRWEITPEGDGSLLVLLHRPLAAEPAVHYCTGWHAMLDGLEAHLDGVEPAEPDYAGLHTLYAAAIR